MPKTKKTSSEPEVLALPAKFPISQVDVNGREKTLDAYASALADDETHQGQIGVLIQSVTGTPCTTDRLGSLTRLMRGDKRFEVFTKEGKNFVRLTGTTPPQAHQKSPAFIAGMKAHNARVELFDNPRSSQEAMLDWEDGWMAAENGALPQKYEEAKPLPFPSEVQKDEEESEPDLEDDEGGDDALAKEETQEIPKVVEPPKKDWNILRPVKLPPLERFHLRSQALTEEYFRLIEDEQQIAEDLKLKRKAIEQLVATMVEHGRSDLKVDWRDQ